MCPNTCLAYTGEFVYDNSCCVCGEARYNTIKKKHIPRQHFHTIPIGGVLQALYQNPQSARDMGYRKEQTKKLQERCTIDESGNVNIPVFEDFTNGADYFNGVREGRIGDDDIFLVLSIDGAQLYEGRSSDCWMYIWIIFELGPDKRYKKKYVIPSGFIPGPNKPKILDSFLFPGLLHVAALQKEGLKIWNAATRQVLYKTPFVAFGTADGPGLIYLNGFAGHNGYFGCRLGCPTPGWRTKTKHHYYPVLQRPHGDLPKGSDHSDVDVNAMAVAQFANYQENLAKVLAASNARQYKLARLFTGISKQSIFSGLDPAGIFPIPTCFPSDMMHLICLNLTDLLLPLWRGTFDCSGSDKATWDWAVLTGDVWIEHGQHVESLHPYLISSIKQPPRNIEKKISSGYKAQEWLIYVFGYCPAILHGLLPERYWLNFCKLVAGVRLLSARTITMAQALKAHELLISFVQEFEEIYVQRNPARMHFIRPSIHNLIHLAPETFRAGHLGHMG
ncbi:hypothetical protein NMY22_g18562 [Coprinellus aureogranulatus]|nr:hypothetical protein NMY22_g18562 [Coprinellus aureogranulatus]